MPELAVILDFFREISKIPRKSGDEEGISSFLLDFARQNHLEAYRDDAWNVIIKKPAQNLSGSVRPAIILQCHTDMVYVTESGCEHDYKSGISVIEKEGYLKAEGTSLGADNGMGIAFCLAILASKSVSHPDLEVVFTSQEEVGLVGVKFLDMNRLNGRAMINLDAEEEGVLIASCAGGVRGKVKVPVDWEKVSADYRVSLSFNGLPGGHSGLEISKQIPNAIDISEKLLNELEGMCTSVIKWSCSGQANLISSQLDMELAVSQGSLLEVKTIVKRFENSLIHKGQEHFSISLSYMANEDPVSVLTETSLSKLRNLIQYFPKGVLAWNPENAKEVQTSINLGALTLDEGMFELLYSIRSSVLIERLAIQNKITQLCDQLNMVNDFFNAYPPWEYRQQSPLREQAKTCYEKLFGKELKIAGIHGGLECSYFADKLTQLDVISLGANLFDAHTPRERMEIKSIEQFWELLKCIIANFKNTIKEGT